ncbi:hypothetical protein FS749_007707 [Ceratobasidium sp. UAMH 11750]|nr:hypothetical protein FS749_007707 [Ceratobasidium sp. UAMH 11750]
MINEPFEWTKSQMAAGTASPSILKTLLTEMTTTASFRHSIELEEDMIRWVVGTMYAAGADTVLCPNIPQPILNTKSVIQIVASVMTFILAMILHPTIQEKAQAELDGVLGQNRLPELSDRGSLPYMDRILKEVSRWNSVTPLGLAHASTQDDEYKGYRIPKGAIAPAFGFGRRICPGANFAESSMFIIASTLLTIFNITSTPGKPAPEAKWKTDALIA